MCGPCHWAPSPLSVNLFLVFSTAPSFLLFSSFHQVCNVIINLMGCVIYNTITQPISRTSSLSRFYFISFYLYTILPIIILFELFLCVFFPTLINSSFCNELVNQWHMEFLPMGLTLGNLNFCELQKSFQETLKGGVSAFGLLYTINTVMF